MNDVTILQNCVTGKHELATNFTAVYIKKNTT